MSVDREMTKTPSALKGSRHKSSRVQKKVTFNLPSTSSENGDSNKTVGTITALAEILSKPDWIQLVYRPLQDTFAAMTDETYDLFKSCLQLLVSEETPPIFVTFQIGASQVFLEYFWRQQHLYEPVWITNFDDLPSEPSILILSSFDPQVVDANLPKVRQQKHFLMIASNIDVLFEHKNWFLNKIASTEVKILNFIMTPHDFKTRINSIFQCPDNRLSQHLVDRGSIPLAMLHLCQFDMEVLDVILYKKGSEIMQTLLGHLFVMGANCSAIKASWQFNGISYITLARMIGLYVIDTHDNFFGFRDVIVPDTSNTTPDKEKRFRIIWPSRIEQRFFELYPPALKRLLPHPPNTEAPSEMEFFAVQSLSSPVHDNKTLGERFKFLRPTLIANYSSPHGRPIMVPKVVTGKRLPSHEWTPDRIHDMLEMHFDDLVHLVHIAPEGRLMIFRPGSHSPDMMVVYHSFDAKENKMTHHILAIKIKSGLNKEINENDMLRELGKCPLTKVLDHPSFVLVDFNESSGPNRYTLTFVLAAMNYDKLKGDLEACKSCLSKHENTTDEYLHCTSQSRNFIPNGVDAIVLTRIGLIELLGQDNYQFLQDHKASNELAKQEQESGAPASQSSLSNMDAMQPSINAKIIHRAIDDVPEESKAIFVPKIVDYFHRLLKKARRVRASDSDQDTKDGSDTPIDDAVSCSTKRPLSEVDNQDVDSSSTEPLQKKRKIEVGSENPTECLVDTNQSAVMADQVNSDLIECDEIDIET